MSSNVPPINCNDSGDFEDLNLERRLIEAHKVLLDNADFDLPTYDHLKCCRFITACRRLIAMHPTEIGTGSGSSGQGGHFEKYDIKNVSEMLTKAETAKARYGPADGTAAIDFGVEQNRRGYFNT